MDHPYLLGLAGAALPDVIRLIKGRYDGPLPTYFSSPSFFVGFPLLVGLGALAVYLGQPSSVKEALAYGFGAPELVSRIFAQSGTQSGKQADRGSLTLRVWWAR
jgi:hypothetical protein